MISVIVLHLRIRLISILKGKGDFLVQEKVKHTIITPVYSFCLCAFRSLFPSCAAFTCALFLCRSCKLRAPHQRTTDTENHTQTLADTTLYTFTPLFVLLCFVLLCFPFKVCVSSVQDLPHPPEHVSQNRTCRSLGRT